MTEYPQQEPENTLFNWDDPWLFLILAFVFTASSEELQAVSEKLRKTLE